MDGFSQLGLILRATVLMLVITSPFWVGGALLGAALPRPKIGWWVRVLTAVSGAVAIVLSGWFVWWLIDIGNLAHEPSRVSEASSLALNGLAAVAAIAILSRRYLRRRSRNRQAVDT